MKKDAKLTLMKEKDFLQALLKFKPAGTVFEGDEGP